MKRVLWLDDHQLDEWDSFVLNHPRGMIYHLSAWRAVLEKSFSHIKGHFLAIFDNREIVGGLPVYEVTSRLTGRRLVSIPFATLCDPLVFSTEAFESAWQALMTLYKRCRSSYLEIRAKDFRCPGQNFRIAISTPYRHHYLLLNQTPETLMESFTAHCRRNCRKALASGLHLRIARNEADLRDFFGIYAGTRKRLGLPPIPYKLFQVQWKTFFRADRLTLLFAEYKNQKVAAAYLLKFKGLVILEANCDRPQFRNLRINYFLYQEAIKMAHREGYACLSFGRTHLRNAGLLAFKRGWGTREEGLREMRFPRSAAPRAQRKLDSPVFEVLRTFSRFIPDRFLNYYGELVYRHMG